MARYTQSEFAKACGVDKAKISVYKSRGKIFVGEDGYIHDSVQVNADFLKKHQEKLSGSDTSTLSTEKREKQPTQGRKSKEITPEGAMTLSLDQEKKKYEIEKLKVDTRLAALKEEKIKGEVVPIALVGPVFQAHHQSIITSQKENIEVLILELSKEHRFTGEQTARLRGKLIGILNAGSLKAVSIAESHLRALSDEYASKKEVGEHE